MNARVLEQATLLGNRRSMVGIVTMPSTTARADMPTVVILNAGIVHRAGPNRLSVLLARGLAAIGCPVLRFDLSGIGDSEPRADGLAPIEASLADIREALDWMTATRQTQRVVLVGLCSGADHAAIYSGSDPRVVGAVLIDPSIPRTRGYYARLYGQRVFRFRSWVSLFGSLASSMRPRAQHVAPEDQPASEGPSLQDPSVRSFLERSYQSAIEQRVQLLTVLTGGREHLYNYREQFTDAFAKIPFGRHLRLEYFAESDHTFDAEHERTRLIELIVEWAGSTAFEHVEADIEANG